MNLVVANPRLPDDTSSTPTSSNPESLTPRSVGSNKSAMGSDKFELGSNKFELGSSKLEQYLPFHQDKTHLRCTSDAALDLVVSAPQRPPVPEMSPPEFSPKSSPRTETPWGSSCHKSEQYCQDKSSLKCTSELESRVEELLQGWMEHFDRRLDQLTVHHQQKAKSVLTLKDGLDVLCSFEVGSQISGTPPTEARAGSSTISESSAPSEEKSAGNTSPRPVRPTAMTGSQSSAVLSGSAALSNRRSVQNKMTELHCQLVWNKLQPQNESMLKKLLQHPFFENFLACVILVDGLLIGMQVEVAARSGASDQLVFSLSQYILFAIFGSELFLRICALRSQWPRSFFNIFDALLVLVQLSEFVVKFCGGNAYWKGTALGRLFRFLRMARITRLIRLFRVFSQLLLMLKMIWFSLESLFWLMILLVVKMYVVAIIFTQGVTDYKLSDQAGFETAASLERYFGDLAGSALSLFKAITNGISWGILSDLLFEVNFCFGVIFVIYIFFVFFSVLNVVTGVFVDGAIRHAGQQREVLVAAERKNMEEICRNLTELLVEIDLDNSGTISRDEFMICSKDPKLASYLCALGIDTYETSQLFSYLDSDQSGDIELQEFIDGCIKLRGDAKSIDLHLLMFRMESEYREMRSLLDATLCEQKNTRRLLFATLDRVSHDRDDGSSAPTKTCNIPMVSSYPTGEAQAGVPKAGVPTLLKKSDAERAACAARFLSM